MMEYLKMNRHKIIVGSHLDFSLLYLLKCKHKESLPLTNMRYINGWVESLVLRRKAEDFSVYIIMRIEQ